MYPFFFVSRGSNPDHLRPDPKPCAERVKLSLARGAAKKSSSTNNQANKRGRGKGRAIKEKELFFKTLVKKVPMAIKLEGGGGRKALMA